MSLLSLKMCPMGFNSSKHTLNICVPVVAALYIHRHYFVFEAILFKLFEINLLS